MARPAVASVWAAAAATFSTAVIATGLWLRWFRATSPYCEVGTCSGSIDGVDLERLWSEGAAALDAAGAPGFVAVGYAPLLWSSIVVLGLTMPVAVWAVRPLLAPEPPRTLVSVALVLGAAAGLAVAVVLLDLGGFAWLTDVTE